jgi:hypothetical protein
VFSFVGAAGRQNFNRDNEFSTPHHDGSQLQFSTDTHANFMLIVLKDIPVQDERSWSLYAAGIPTFSSHSNKKFHGLTVETHIVDVSRNLILGRVDFVSQ